MAWISREKEWRKAFTKALKEAGKWEEFRRIWKDYNKQAEASGISEGTAADWRAWHDAAMFFPDVLDLEKFNLERKLRVARERHRRKKAGFKMAGEERSEIAKEKDKLRDTIGRLRGRPRLTSEEAFEIVNPPLPDEVVIYKTLDINDDGNIDILRDTKWVYMNMARLIKTGKGGIKMLDAKALKEAPSNGAVGLAHYALNDSKAFFERFVTKILPKDEIVPPPPTEEEIKAEVDPSFDELEKYIKKL